MKSREGIYIDGAAMISNLCWNDHLRVRDGAGRLSLSGSGENGDTGRHGYILVQVLVVFFILIFFILSMTQYVLSIERTVASMVRRDDIRIQMRSYLYEWIERIQKGEISMMLGDSEVHPRGLDVIHMTVEDETGKIDLKPFAAKSGVSPDSKNEDVLKALFENRHLSTDELIFFRGELAEFERGLVEHLDSFERFMHRYQWDISNDMTFYSDGKINVVSASEDVLTAHFGNSEAQKMIALRESKSPESQNYGTLNLQNRDKVTTSGRYYKVRAASENDAMKTTVIIEMDQGQIIIREWAEE